MLNILGGGEGFDMHMLGGGEGFDICIYWVGVSVGEMLNTKEERSCSTAQVPT